MLPTSVRRVVASAPQGGLAPCLAASAPKAATAASPIFARGHQRRCSSSKPSSSDNGSSEIPTGQSVPASSSARKDGQSAGEGRKRKNKVASERNASMKKLPSVPSTHHISPSVLGLSSFFSLHRPISVTQTMPRSVTDEHFASIFGTRAKTGKVTDNIATISSTIDQLEKPMAQMTIGGQQDGQSMGDGVHRIELENPEDGDASIYLQVDAMSGEFLPFRPPPLPQAQAGAGGEGGVAEAEAADDAGQHRVYNAMFTIEESTEPNGQIRIVAHSPRIVDEDQPRSFLERLAQRQLKLDESRGKRGMHAISVKRIRKLKMKKKKYKKLQKRTRNLRRKLDKI